MIVVSSKKFRNKQKNYLNRVDEGAEILIRRGKNKSYKIVPATADNTEIGEEYILEPDEDLARAITGEELLERLIPRIKKLFDK